MGDSECVLVWDGNEFHEQVARSMMVSALNLVGSEFVGDFGIEFSWLEVGDPVLAFRR